MKHGIDIILNSDVAAIIGEEHVESVQLKDERILEADLVVVGKGVRPNILPFQEAGLILGQGVLVNEYLETNLPNVYAAGDVAETYDFLRDSPRINAIWPNATRQGYIAGLNMTGKPTAYSGSMGMNAVDFFGLRIISAGIIKLPVRQTAQVSDSQSWYTTEDYYHNFSSGQVTHQYLTWQGDKLKGYVLIGSPERAGVLTALIQAQKEIAQDVIKGLRGGKRGRGIK